MTSQRFWADMTKENIKQRLWPIALSTLGSFFALTVLGVLELGIWENRLSMNSMKVRDITNAFAFQVLGVGNVPVLLLIMGMAMINALQGFHYLQDARGTDLYGSLPIKRQTLYDIVSLNSFAIFALPFTVFHMITMFIGLARGYVSGKSFIYIILSLLAMLAAYLVMYMTAVLAVMLTGNWIVAILGTAVFCGVFPFLSLAIDSYLSEFYLTYYSYYGGSVFANNFLMYCSPIGLYVKLIGEVTLQEHGGVNPVLDFTKAGIITAVIMLTAAVILFFICRKLVSVRKGEAAGRSMAFAKTKPFIKVLILVPASLMAGLLFYEVADMRLGWLFFGIIACLLIGHGIIEIIYETDFKAAFGGRVSLIASCAVTAFILFMLFFDPLGYECSRPSPSKVAEVSVYDNSLFPNISYRDHDGEYGSYYVDSMTFINEHMHLENTEALDRLYGKGSAYARKNHFKAIVSRDTYYDNYGNEKIEIEEHRYHNVVISWKLKNGRCIMRRYPIDMNDEESLAIMTELFAQPEFKDGILQGMTIDPQNVSWFSLNNYLLENEGDNPLTPEESAALLSAYRSDVYNMSFDEIRSSLPSVLLHVGSTEKPVNGSMYYETLATLPIYPSYTNTIRFLTERGIDPTWYTGYEDLDRVNLEVEHNRYYGYSEVNSIKIDGKDKVKEIMDAAIPRELWIMGEDYMSGQPEDDLVYVYIYFGKNDEYCSEYVLKKSKLPADVRDEIERLSDNSDFGG